MTISEQSARLIYEAIAYTIGRIYPDLCEAESPLDVINDNAKEFMTDFCAIKGIDKVAMDEDEEDEDIPADRNDEDMINNEYYGDSQWCECHGYSYTVKNGIFYWQTNYQTGEKGLDKEIHWHEHDYFDRVINDDEDYDIPDDVDETNYDPYLGQDFYE